MNNNEHIGGMGCEFKPTSKKEKMEHLLSCRYNKDQTILFKLLSDDKKMLNLFLKKLAEYQKAYQKNKDRIKAFMEKKNYSGSTILHLLIKYLHPSMNHEDFNLLLDTHDLIITNFGENYRKDNDGKHHQTLLYELRKEIQEKRETVQYSPLEDEKYDRLTRRVDRSINTLKDNNPFFKAYRIMRQEDPYLEVVGYGEHEKLLMDDDKFNEFMEVYRLDGEVNRINTFRRDLKLKL